MSKLTGCIAERFFGDGSLSIARREPLAGHDGRSGARLDHVTLTDGRRLVVKTSTPGADLVRRMSADVAGRERELWEAGVLAALPTGIGSAIVAAWSDGDRVVTVMRDVGDAVIGWRSVTHRECERLLTAVTEMHAAFADRHIAQACPLRTRLRMLYPEQIRNHGHDDPLARLVLRGWERFTDLVPSDVAEAVAAIHADPERLAGPLAMRPATLIHGDLTLPNAAFEVGQVTLLDWGLATRAPAALELVQLLATCASSIQATREQVITDFRTACGQRDDPTAVRLALLAGLAEMGWNKALDITEHPDEDTRNRERTDLGWWISQARQTLDAGLL